MKNQTGSKHKINKVTKTTWLLLALFFASALIFSYGFVRQPADTASPQSQEMPLIGKIHGLTPDQLVSYRVGSGSSKQARADNRGVVTIHRPENIAGSYAENLNLNIDIKDAEKALDLRFSLHESAGRFDINGSGLEKFTDIRLDKGNKIFETKSDWTGGFALSGFDDKDTKSPYKVALSGSDFMGDVTKQNPLVIEVLTTDGGGGPTSNRVNSYEPEGCKSFPDINPSVCQDKFDDHNKEMRKRYVPALQFMGLELTSAMMKHIQTIGQMMDAKMQMQTQANIQKLQAQAHKDYHPSEQMCRFGSFVKSIATVEESAKFNALAINKAMMDRYTNTHKIGAPHEETKTDMELRLKQFREVYCDPKDLNSGLQYMCQHNISNDDQIPKKNEKIGGQDPKRINNDIDYTRMVDTPLTIASDMTDENVAPHEEDMIALAKNLYWPETFPQFPPDKLEEGFTTYLQVRHIMALQNIAHNSFSQIVGMKSASVPTLGEESGSAFMKSFMREFGLGDEEINQILGENPSYYAQMEVLTKKMYQSPNFYTNLYDKPANIRRINAAMEAIKLMQMRDWFKTNLRKEMITSVLLEKGLDPLAEEISQRIGSAEAKQ